MATNDNVRDALLPTAAETKAANEELDQYLLDHPECKQHWDLREAFARALNENDPETMRALEQVLTCKSKGNA